MKNLDFSKNWIHNKIEGKVVVDERLSAKNEVKKKKNCK